VENCETLQVLNVDLCILYNIRLQFESFSVSFLGSILMEGKGKAVPLQAWRGPEGS